MRTKARCFSPRAAGWTSALLPLLIAFVAAAVCATPAGAILQAGFEATAPPSTERGPSEIQPSVSQRSSLIGEPAPPFALPTVTDEQIVYSDTLLESAAVTLLTFWTTHCAECIRRLEICQELDRWGREDGVRAFGVNFDETPSARIQLMVRQATPQVTHVFDAGGQTAARYGAGAHSFSVFLIDAARIVRDAFFEIPADSLAGLRPRLSRLIEEAYGGGEEGLTGTEMVTTTVSAAAPATAPPQDAEEAKPLALAQDAAPATTPAPAQGAAQATTPAPAQDAEPEPARSGLLEEFGLLKRQRLEVHGVGRVRWMHIKGSGEDPTGSYGERIDPGASLRHRLELQMIYAVSAKLRVGGLLWLSNEGEAVLRSGPDYLTSAWGSAFIRYDTSARLGCLGRLRAALRAGYYDLHFTPLTLMRWDKDDSPISGGQRVQGCAVCGGEAGLAGFIRSESVEKLGPDYTFEGARADLSLGGSLDLTAIYARPRESWPEHRGEISPETRTELTYRQEIYGGRLTGLIPLAWTSQPATLSSTLLLITDDTEDWPWGETYGIWPEYAPGTVRLLGGDVVLPLPSRMELRAELLQSRWDEETREVGEPSPDHANAFRGEWILDLRSGGAEPLDWLLGLLAPDMTAKINLAYQRSGAGFFSPYGALSYDVNLRPSPQVIQPGLEGPRAWMRVDWRIFGGGVFGKWLDPVDPHATAETGGASGVPGGKWRMTSLWADAALWPGGVLTAGWVRDERDPLAVQTETLREERRTLVVGLEQELAPRCVLLLEGQFLDGVREPVDDAAGLIEEDYSTRTLRVMLDVEF
ncbi:MAG: redoxin domain-containing protein [Candidatus Eisenbacteria sp.]|nr:redoxin domain-containing protein [Candidatus Eisenbacteria bacterium]